MDFFYLGIVIVLFVVTLGLMKLCEVLGQFKSGDKS